MIMGNTLYPDIETAGSLHVALISEMGRLGSAGTGWALQTDGGDTDTVLGPFTITDFNRGHRSSQVFMASDERLFLFDFWSRGIIMGTAKTSILPEVASAMYAWLVELSPVAEMAIRFPGFEADEQAESVEKGEEVEWAWRRLRLRASEDTGRFAAMLPLLDDVMRRPELRQLFPFTSHDTLCFSRTTGYPYTQDCPSAAHVKDDVFGAFRLADQRFVPLGEGNVSQVADLLISALPPNCGPAIPGTAKDLK